MSAQLVVSVTDGALLSAATETDGSTPVSVKSIERAFLPFNDGSGQFPIPISTRDRHMEVLKRRYQQQVNLDPTLAPTDIVASRFELVRHGNTIYVRPPDTTALGGSSVTVGLDIVRWLPDYTEGGAYDTDFFLDQCEDFMLFRTILELNFFLKQDQRVQISAATMTDAWASVLAWDSSLVENKTDDNNLD